MRLGTGCPDQSRSGCGRSNFCEGASMATPALARDFKEFLKSLNSNSVEYLLIGGYAVWIYGHIRATNDLDIWVNVSPKTPPTLSGRFARSGLPRRPDLRSASCPE